MKFDDKPYFSDLESIAEGVIEDICKMSSLTGSNIVNVNVNLNEADARKAKDLMATPIYRGYTEDEKSITYLDVYRHRGEVYTENELKSLIKDKAIILAEITRAYEKSAPYDAMDSLDDEYEYDVQPEVLGLTIEDLFYYKDGPCGMGSPYVVKKEELPLKFVVECSYNWCADCSTIRHATKEDLERDGDHWCEKNSSYRLNCYDTIEQAIENAGFWPTCIYFEGEFSDEEKEAAATKVNALVSDHDFCSKFCRFPNKKIYSASELFPNEKEMEM